MSALPKILPITVRPTRRPQYKAGPYEMSRFDRFYAANEPALIQYWNELGYGEASEAEDFVDFACAQHDLEKATRDVGRSAL